MAEQSTSPRRKRWFGFSFYRLARLLGIGVIGTALAQFVYGPTIVGFAFGEVSGKIGVSLLLFCMVDAIIGLFTPSKIHHKRWSFPLCLTVAGFFILFFFANSCTARL